MRRFTLHTTLCVLASAFALSRSLLAQESPAGPPASVTFTTQQDHQNMLEQLGITRLRPGPNGNESAPNHANYDEALANPYPDLPDPLTLANGERVATPEAWWQRRRPEIVEDFEREVLGRVPKDVPKVRLARRPWATCRWSRSSSRAAWTTRPARRSR
jgi:hypothetical protein